MRRNFVFTKSGLNKHFSRRYRKVAAYTKNLPRTTVSVPTSTEPECPEYKCDPPAPPIHVGKCEPAICPQGFKVNYDMDTLDDWCPK